MNTPRQLQVQINLSVTETHTYNIQLFVCVAEGAENGAAGTAGANVFSFQTLKRKNKMAQLGKSKS